jgi:hypothetical protein
MLFADYPSFQWKVDVLLCKNQWKWHTWVLLSLAKPTRRQAVSNILQCTEAKQIKCKKKHSPIKRNRVVDIGPQGCRWRQYVPLIHWYLRTRPCGPISTFLLQQSYFIQSFFYKTHQYTSANNSNGNLVSSLFPCPSHIVLMLTWHGNSFNYSC